jgi:hypothetical protein
MALLERALCSDMLSAETRWERLATGLFITGCLFVAFTVHGLYSGDDWRGLVMTAAPGAVVFGLWYLARARADYLGYGVEPPFAITAISAAIIVVGIGFGIHHAVNAPEVVYLTDVEHEDYQRRRALERIDFSGLETREIEVTLANGEKGMVKSIVRKQRPESECEEWTEVPHPNREGDIIWYCARWAPQ